MIAVTLIVSYCDTLREINFLADLKSRYSQDLINRLFADQINRRIRKMIEFSGQSNLTSDQLTFTSVSILSLQMIGDLVNKSNNQILTPIDNELYKYLAYVHFDKNLYSSYLCTHEVLVNTIIVLTSSNKCCTVFDSQFL